MAATPASALTTNYTDTFESYSEGTQLTNGLNYWHASDTNVIVQTNNAAPGSAKAAMLPIDTTLSNRYSITNPTNVWVHLEIQPARYNGTNYPDVGTNTSAFFFLDSNGYFVAYDGSASNWITITQTVSGVPVPQVASNTWVTNVDVFINYSTKSWQFAQGTNLLTRNLRFADTNLSAMNGFDVYDGGAMTSYLDNVYVYDQAPFAGYIARPSALTNWVIKGTTAATQQFDIIGTGIKPSAYTIVTNGSATWLSASPGSGTITNGLTNVVTVSYPSSATLATGTHTSSLSVVNSYGAGSTQTVAVTLNVVDISFSTNYLSSACMYGYAPSSQTFDIVMADTSAPTFTITTNVVAPWMTVTPGSGTLSVGTHTIAANFSTNALAVGVHTAILDVVIATGINLTQQVTVVATAVSRPIPAISTNSFVQTIYKGLQPATTNIIISNSGDVPRARMNYAVTSDVPWLMVNTTGVCTNGEDHTIAVQFANMATNTGTNTGYLTVQTVDGGTGYTPVGQVSSLVQVVVRVLIIGEPGIPGNLTATEGTDTGGIQLSWVAAATNVNHYEVWRGATNNIASATILASDVTGVTYYDTTIDPGLKRWYWVRAINDYGGAGDFSVPDLGWRFLPAPTGLTATSGTYTNRVALSWTAASGAITYEVWRSIYTNLGLAVMIASNLPGSATSYDDTTGDAVLTYYYWVRSCAPDMGNYSDFASGYRAALMKPSNISASKGTFSSKIRVMWQAVDAAIKYEVWRSTDTNVDNAVRIGTVTIRGFDDTQASTSPVFYYYWIKAHNAQGFASPYSELDSGWLQLAIPANVTATQGTRPYSVRISWNPVENATSYEVVRRSSPSLAAQAQSLAESTPLAAYAPSLSAGSFMLGEPIQTFFDDNATYAGASYLYGVRAKNALGNSELSGEAIGWRQVQQATTTKPVANDYDGDKLADIVLFNPDSGLWRILCTTLGEFPLSFGDATCVPVPGDYDGDGLADPMIYSADQSYWRVMMSLAGYLPPIQATFGGPGQLAAAEDYDGDRLTDPATYQAATGILRVMLSKSGYVPPSQVPIGGPGYVGACADYDGDGKADPAVYSATDGLLRVKCSNSGYYEALIPLGGDGMVVVPGDFDGDGKSDLTTYNEATGTLSVKLSSAEYWQADLALGGPGYAWIVPSDYDGDGLLDPAAYSQTDGWMIIFSRLNYATLSDTFGGTNNVPFVP